MILGLTSDVHSEHLRLVDDRTSRIDSLFQNSPKLDLLVLAGDITSLAGDKWKSEFDYYLAYCPNIIYVPGNHEFYDTGKNFDIPARLKQVESHGIHVLGPYTKPSVEIQGQKFVGTTLWYKYNQDMAYKWQSWSDHFIGSMQFWWPTINQIEAVLLWNNVTPGSIVVTHMLPSWQSVHPKYANSPDNHFYVNDSAEEIIWYNKPKLWLHGHTHDHCDYTIDETRVIAKACGYPKFGYREIFIMEI